MWSQEGFCFLLIKKVKVTAYKDDTISCFYTDGGEAAERENVVLCERKIDMGKGS